MSKRLLLIFTLAGVAFITMGMQCGKERALQIIPVHQYAEKLTLAPFKKVYAINDTIWVQFQTTDKMLYDKLSGRRLSTDTTFLKVVFNLVRQYPVEFISEMYADVTVENGLEVNFEAIIAPRDALTFHTGCSNNPYFFKAGFVLKKTGVYTLEPGAYVSPCTDKTTDFPSSFTFTFDLPDCNYDVWLEVGDKSYSTLYGYTDFGIKRKEIFAFRVE